MLHSTRWNDNDVYGHMNNVVHYALFDSTVNDWLIARGLLDPRGGTHIGLVTETGCRYHGEMRFPDRVTAGLRVAKLGTSSVRYEVGLFRNDEDRASAEGFFVHVYVDAGTRRPVPFSADLRTALETLVR
ncbi:MAG: thioesterase family protein [Gemmobacter sp.]|nr:thioesterase family protein [Gemmobacter sp.]